MVYRGAGSWVSAAVQSERKNAGRGPEFVGVRGPARPSDDGASHQTPPEVG